MDASQEQLSAIYRLYEQGRVEGLPEKLKETIVLRETFPELSWSELAAQFDPPISKSALNHRLRKLVELAKAEPENCTSQAAAGAGSRRFYESRC